MTRAELIRRRRLEVGLSCGELADAMGCTLGLIQSIENSGAIDTVPFRIVAALRRALGLSWDELEHPDGASDVSPDQVMQLCAEAVRHGRVLIADINATADHAAVTDQVNDVLKPTGLVALLGPDGSLSIEAHIPRSADARSSTTRRIASGRPSKRERDVIARLLKGPVSTQRLARSERRALISLVHAGLATSDGGEFVASPVLSCALGLE